jgi:hypothetical protein
MAMIEQFNVFKTFGETAKVNNRVRLSSFHYVRVLLNTHDCVNYHGTD